MTGAVRHVVGHVVGRAGLRALLLDALRLWGVDGTAEWDGPALRLRAGGAVATLEPAASPVRWMLDAGGRRRPCVSLPVVLSVLRDRLAPGAPAGILRPAVPLPAGEQVDLAGRTPVLTVTGALGSGKTTMVARLLRDPAQVGTAVIVNEFGAVGLDHHLLATSTEQLVALPSGCLCCAVRGDLMATLLDLGGRRARGEIAFRRVLIETSGLADPAPILQALLTDPAVAGRFASAGVVTLVDAVHGAGFLRDLLEAGAQIALADRVVFTRVDIAPVPPALRNAVASANPGVPTLDAAHGDVPASWLWDPPGRAPRRVPAGPALHADGVGSTVLAIPAPLPPAALSLFLAALADQAGPRLLRLKGLVAVEGLRGPLLVQAVRHLLEPAAELPGWPAGADSAVVVIGRGIPPAFPSRLLAAIEAEVRDEIALSTTTQEPPMTQRPIGRRTLGRLAAGTVAGLAAPAIGVHAQPATLRIANIQPITGASAAYGWRARDGAALAAEEINAKGLQVGGATFRIAIGLQDMANDPQQAVTLLRQAAADTGNAAMIGPSNSVGYVPCVPAAGQLSMPLVGAGSGAPIKSWNKWSFRVNPVSDTAIPVLVEAVHKKVGFKKLAVIYDQTQDGQAGDAQVAKAQAAKLGYQVVAFEAFRSGDQDFSAQLATIRVARPDALFVAAATGDGVKLATQIRELGITAPMMTGFGSFQDPVYWDGTKGVIKDSYTWLAQDLASPTPAVRTFIETYKTKFGQDATSFSTYGADALSAIAAAAVAAGSIERGKLGEALAALDTTTPLGTHLTFKNPPTGENLTPHVVVIQITGRGTYAAV